MSYRWANQEHTHVIRLADSANIPAVPGNRDYDDLIASGAEVDRYRRWETLETAQAALTAAVKAEASARILAFMPDWKQRNATAHGLAMVRKVQLGEELTADEIAAEDAYQAAWGYISSVRAASNVKEASIAALADLDAAEAFDLATGWPIQP
jgi:hypothetical protein